MLTARISTRISFEPASSVSCAVFVAIILLGFFVTSELVDGDKDNGFGSSTFLAFEGALSCNSSCANSFRCCLRLASVFLIAASRSISSPVDQSDSLTTFICQRKSMTLGGRISGKAFATTSSYSSPAKNPAERDGPDRFPGSIMLP